MNSAGPSEPHCLHLLEAHSAELLAECHRGRLYLALCGEELATQKLPSPDCEPGCERDVVYCLACIRAASRHNYEVEADVDCPSGVIVRVDR